MNLNNTCLRWVLSACMLVSSAHADVIDTIKSRGTLKCGVNTGLVGFSYLDEKSNWNGFDVDFCKAIAATILGDANKVEFVPLTGKVRFTALSGGEVDVLIRNTTWNFTRDNALGVAFSEVNFYDGQGFMVNKNKKVSSVLELDKASICVLQGTTTERNLADYFNEQGMQYKAVYFDRPDQLSMSYEAGQCDAVTADTSALAGIRTVMKDPAAHSILPEVISKEPLGIVVRDSDMRMLKLSRWVVWALLEAEHLGISKANVEGVLKDKASLRLFSMDKDGCAALGISPDFMVPVLKSVGNYKDIFDKNVGALSKLKLSRGQNALWVNGGLQYVPPIN